MINSLLRKQIGAAALIFTAILLTMSTLIILFAANFGRMQDKAIANLHRHQQAFTAADAGVEFGINYLLQNRNTITGSPSGGYIAAYSDASTTNVALTNNSQFTVVYTNPTANNYDLILITSTGVSDDGSATRVVKQLVQFDSLLATIPTNPLSVVKDITIGGNSNIVNTESNTTIVSGEEVNFNGFGRTTLSSGISSTSSSTKSDVQQNNSTLEDLSASQLFANYFGASQTTVKNSMAHVYTNSISTNYSTTLNGMTGTTIWITQSGGTATINGNTTIGSAANPVILIVDGSLRLNGNVTIYGLVFTTGTATNTDLLGNINIQGGFISVGQLSLTGSATMTYNSATLNAVQNINGVGYFAKVQGSWSDF